MSEAVTRSCFIFSRPLCDVTLLRSKSSELWHCNVALYVQLNEWKVSLKLCSVQRSLALESLREKRQRFEIDPELTQMS